MNTITFKTKCGDIIGEQKNGAAVFHNIPFATADRFESPVPIDHFDSVVDSTGPYIECLQYSSFVDDSDRFFTKEFRRNQTFTYCEDTLYLSITSPLHAKGCPVLVHIHGGGFMTGKQGEYPCADSFEYAKRGIVLVSISYRMNIFALYRSKNLHIEDQLCALNWIKENICDYGGDPDNITLIGESAGGISIFHLLFYEGIERLISRAVIMSGIMPTPGLLSGYTADKSKKHWDKIMHSLGAHSDEDMKKFPADKLWHAWDEADHGLKKLRYDQPGIDNTFITDAPGRMLKTEKLADIPIMAGVTSQDMYLPIVMFSYLKRFADEWDRRQNSDIFLYYFDHISPGGPYRAFHSSDLWYMYGNLKQSSRPFGNAEEKIKDNMIDCVSRFIYENDPGWDAYKRKNKKIRHIRTEKIEYLKGTAHYMELFLNTFFRRGPV